MTKPRYRDALPQLNGRKMLTDGGLETCLIFHQGIDLPLFASFDLLKTQTGTKTLMEYYIPYLKLALDHGLGFILEAPTWRANRAWAEQLGYTPEALKTINLEAIEAMCRLRETFETTTCPMVVSGTIGPRGDGYVPSESISLENAADYHSEQIGTFAASSADMVTALTLSFVEEAIGITNAATEADIPVAIGFTLETDGRLPSGQTLEEAIQQTDAEAHRPPIYYLINCAHPSHFIDAVSSGATWTQRIQGLRANASRKSHSELDGATTLDDGDPIELAQDYRDLQTHLTNLCVFGGCCGTDHRHIEAIAKSLR